MIINHMVINHIPPSSTSQVMNDVETLIQQAPVQNRLQASGFRARLENLFSNRDSGEWFAHFPLSKMVDWLVEKLKY